jgi:hypothetical protein
MDAGTYLDAQALTALHAWFCGSYFWEKTPVLIALNFDDLVRTHGDARAALRTQVISDNRINVKPVRINIALHRLHPYAIVLP